MSINRARVRLLFFMRQYDRAIEHYGRLSNWSRASHQSRSLARTYELKACTQKRSKYAKYNEISGSLGPKRWSDIEKSSGRRVGRFFAQKIATDMEKKRKGVRLNGRNGARLYPLR